MSLPKILIQLDPDEHASVFDAVVAIDSDVDHLLQYRSVEPLDVRNLVYGAIFTRGPQSLHNTAIFIGGADVGKGESLFRAVTETFFGPMQVSVMMDANGSNTTAAAAVIAAGRHVELASSTTLVLAGTGPVGQRAAKLLLSEGATVKLASRNLDKASEVCERLAKPFGGTLLPVAPNSHDSLAQTLEDCDLVIAAGAAGVALLPESVRANASNLKVAIDLNAVPPLGMEGVEVTANAVQQGGAICYGAIGVGNTKMKVHKACIRQLFQDNRQQLDALEVYAIAKSLESTS